MQLLTTEIICDALRGGRVAALKELDDGNGLRLAFVGKTSDVQDDWRVHYWKLDYAHPTTGEPRSITLDKLPGKNAGFGLEKAREKAGHYRALLDEGIDPSEVEQVVGPLPPDRSPTTWLRTQALEERQKARHSIARAELLERALAVIKRQA